MKSLESSLWKEEKGEKKGEKEEKANPVQPIDASHAQELKKEREIETGSVMKNKYLRERHIPLIPTQLVSSICYLTSNEAKVNFVMNRVPLFLSPYRKDRAMRRKSDDDIGQAGNVGPPVK